MLRVFGCLSLFILTCPAKLVHAAGENLPAGKNVAVQGESIDLPRDLTSRLENGKLRVSLDTLGVPSMVDSARSSLIVRLIGGSGGAQQTSLDSEGIAEFDNVTPDQLHALVVNGAGAHAAIPVMPLSFESAAEKGVSSDAIKIPVLQASSQEILKNLAGYTQYGSSRSSETGTPFGPTQVSTSRTPIYTVRLTTNGDLNGRVIVPETEIPSDLKFANITLLLNSRPIAQTTSNEIDGAFSLASITPGIYGLIAAGPAGYAAYSLEVVSSMEATVSLPSSPIRLVATQAPAAGSLAIVVLVPPSLMDEVAEAIENDYLMPTTFNNQPPAPGAPTAGPAGFPGGGFPGGGFPGGGGAGGGVIPGGGTGGLLGRFGPIAALGAIAGVAAAIAGDDGDDFTNPPVVASPNRFE